MVQYTLSFNINDARVESLNTNGGRLCVARVVKDASGKEHCNIIALARDTIAPHMEITWEDNYQMIGSNIRFKEGDVLNGAPVGLPIEFGQTYKMENWSHQTVFTDPTVKGNSFGFQQEIVCSPILLMEFESRYVPIYISLAEHDPGKTIITPAAKVHIWFQDGAVASTMSVNYKSISHPVELIPNDKVLVNYNKEGKFVIQNPSS